MKCFLCTPSMISFAMYNSLTNNGTMVVTHVVISIEVTNYNTTH